MRFLMGPNTWEDIIHEQQRERIKFLERSAKEALKLGLTRRQAARRMKISYAVLSKLIYKYQIDWPIVHKATGPKSIPLDEYRRCAKLGMNQAEAAEELGVSGPAVSAMSNKYNIKFNRKGLGK
jgi:predicted DNA-binding protein (UPF0251 family)